MNSYEQSIKEEQNNVTINVIGMETAMRYLHAKDRQKKNIEKLITKLTSAQTIKEKRRITSIIKGELTKIQKQQNGATISEIEATFASIGNKHKYEINKSEKNDIIFKISDNPALALKEFASDYTSSISLIESYKKQKEMEEKNVRQKSQEEIDKEENIDNNQVQSIPDYSEYSHKDPEITRRDPISPTAGMNQDELIEHIIQKSQDPQQGSYLTAEERKRIRKEFPNIRYSNDEYSIETIENGLEITRLINQFQNSKKERLSLEDLFELASLIHKTELLKMFRNPDNLSAEKIKFNNLIRKLNISNGFETYDKAYKAYTAYYNSLSEEEKQKVEHSFESNIFDEYKRMFHLDSFQIMTPEQLKSSINEVAKEEMLKPGKEYASSEAKNNSISKIINATKHMTIEEITNIYVQLRNKEEHYHPILLENSTEAELEKISKVREERIEKLQYNFAQAILLKHEKYNKENEAENNKLLVEICEKYFNEKPKFDAQIPTINEPTQSTPASGIKEAEKRFFNLPKLQKTIAKVNGTWEKFEKLRQKETLTKEEQEELETLFRR